MVATRRNDMASYNRVILMGNLTRDIQLRHTPGGTPVTEVGLAVNDRRKNQNGEWVDETTFVDVTFWGKTAEVAAEYLGKGSPVFVEGRLKLDTWEKEGQKNYKLRVVCDRMQMLGAPGGNSPPQRNVAHAKDVDYASEKGEYSPSPSGPPHDHGLEDIPF